MGCSIGPNSLTELRDSFFLAESERLGGFSEKFPRFIGPQALGNLINRLNFQMSSIFVHNVVETAGDFDEILQALKQSGLTGLIGRSGDFGAEQLRDVYTSAMVFYHFVYKNKVDASLVDVTLESLRYVGFKDAENQLQRKVSFDDLTGNKPSGEFDLHTFFDVEGEEDDEEMISGFISEDGKIHFRQQSTSRESMAKEFRDTEKQTKANVEKNRELAAQSYEELQKQLKEKQKLS